MSCSCHKGDWSRPAYRVGCTTSFSPGSLREVWTHFRCTVRFCDDCSEDRYSLLVFKDISSKVSSDCMLCSGSCFGCQPGCSYFDYRKCSLATLSYDILIVTSASSVVQFARYGMSISRATVLILLHFGAGHHVSEVWLPQANKHVLTLPSN